MKQSYPTEGQMQQAIDLIATSLKYAYADSILYEWLGNNIPKTSNYEVQQDVAEIISNIKQDELAYTKILEAIYRQLTGKDVEKVGEKETIIYPKSFIDCIGSIIKNEDQAIKRYKVIMMGMPNNSYRDQLFNMIVGKLQHNNLYNYIYISVLIS